MTLADSFSGNSNQVRQAFAQAILSFPDGAPAWPDFGLSEEAFRHELNTIEPFTVADGFRAFYRLYAKRFDKPRWGDKTPLYAKEISTIRGVLPEARFIHIIRDGRDVALSLRHMWFSPGADVESQAQYWRDFVVAARRDGLGHHDYLEVRYESLILQTAETLRRICQFIELDYEEGMLHYYLRTPERLREHQGRTMPDGAVFTQAKRIRQQQRTTQPPDPSLVFAWKRKMNASERSAFNYVAADLLGD